MTVKNYLGKRRKQPSSKDMGGLGVWPGIPTCTWAELRPSVKFVRVRHCDFLASARFNVPLDTFQVISETVG